MSNETERAEEIRGILESFKFFEMATDRRISFIYEMFKVPIIMEDIKHKTAIGSNGKLGNEWDLNWLVSLIDARIDVVPIPKIFHTR